MLLLGSVVCFIVFVYTQQSSIPLYEYTIPFYSFSVDGIFGSFLVFSCLNKAAVKLLSQILCGHVYLLLLDKHRGVEWVGYRLSVFNFIRNCQVIFLKGCTLLHSQQQFRRVLVVYMYVCV